MHLVIKTVLIVYERWYENTLFFEQTFVCSYWKIVYKHSSKVAYLRAAFILCMRDSMHK